MIISQRRFLEILEETCTLDCKLVGTPIGLNVKLLPRQEEPLIDLEMHQRLIGKLSYLTVTRSSVKTELCAMALTRYELVWMRQLLQEFQFGDLDKMTLICDNQAALHITSYSVVDCYFI